MDVTPNSSQPLDYAERKGRVPTSVMVVSILGILYGALVVLCIPVNIFMLVTPVMANPVMDELRKDQSYVVATLVTSAISFFLGLLLLVSSIGSLRLKPWARTGMNVYAVTSIVMSVVGTVFTLIYVLPRMKTAMEGTAGAEAGLIGGAVGAAVGVLIAAVITLVILIVFNRKVAVNAFKGILPEEPGNFPGEMNG